MLTATILKQILNPVVEKNHFLFTIENNLFKLMGLYLIEHK